MRSTHAWSVVCFKFSKIISSNLPIILRVLTSSWNVTGNAITEVNKEPFTKPEVVPPIFFFNYRARIVVVVIVVVVIVVVVVVVVMAVLVWEE